MLATIISDKFLKHEGELIAKSLDEICSPNDNWGWSSAGLYCFWDSRNSEVLYIGLGVDLPRRFREHIGLISCDPKGCKKDQIDNYFKTNPDVALGYSVILQSKMEQPGSGFLQMILPELGDTGHDNIKANEGLLIQAHLLGRSKIPAWNKVGGSKRGANSATQRHEPILDFLTKVDEDCPFRTTLPLRELAKDGNAARVTEELELHLIRMFALNDTADLRKALDIHLHIQRNNPDSKEVLSRANCQKWIAKWCK